MPQAVKHARLARDVAHLIFPDEVQTEPVAADAPASGPTGRFTPLTIAPPPETLAPAIAQALAYNGPASVEVMADVNLI